jgi:hypothetical protein
VAVEMFQYLLEIDEGGDTLRPFFVENKELSVN